MPMQNSFVAAFVLTGLPVTQKEVVGIKLLALGLACFAAQALYHSCNCLLGLLCGIVCCNCLLSWTGFLPFCVDCSIATYVRRVNRIWGGGGDDNIIQHPV